MKEIDKPVAGAGASPRRVVTSRLPKPEVMGILRLSEGLKEHREKFPIPLLRVRRRRRKSPRSGVCNAVMAIAGRSGSVKRVSRRPREPREMLATEQPKMQA